MSAEPSSKLFANRRPTIGFLAEALVDWYHSGIWHSLAEACRAAGYNLLCITGGALGSSPYDPWEHQRNVIYRLANHHVVDALVLTSSLGNFVDSDVFADFLSGLHELPIVSLAPSGGAVPSAFVDNRRGMHTLITHLIDHHRCRRFAFVRGPEGNREADDRFTACRDLLAERGMPLAPEHVFGGDFTTECGARAATALRSDNHIDALVAANDLSALGALDALRERGRAVPEDLSVVGFDGIEQGAYASPPLTTVRQPLAALSAAAVDMVTRLLRGEHVPHETMLPGQLVCRRSCGCFVDYARQWGCGNETPVVVRTEELVDTLVAESEAVNCAGSGPDRDLLTECVYTFTREVDSGRQGTFGPLMERIAAQELAYGQDLLQWHRILFGLRNHIAASCDTPHARTRAEHLLHEGAVILGNAERRAEGARHISERYSRTCLRETTLALANSLNFEQLMATATDRLPLLAIGSGRIYLYEADGDEPRRAREAVAFGEPSIACDETARVLPIERCAPAGCLTGAPPQVFAVLPLFFQQEQFGYALLDADRASPETLETIRQDISSAVRSTLLMDTVKRQSEQLSLANRQLSELREKEQRYLATLRHDLELGRRIQCGFMPETLPQPGGWDIASLFVPAREVSGDFYDAFMLDDDTLAFVVADVCGKNVGAALFGALVHTLVHVYGERAAHNGRHFDAAVAHINEYIAKHYRQMRNAVVYATLVFGTLHCPSGRVAYINAGHTRPFLIGPAGDFAELDTTGPALGLSVESAFGTKSTTIGPGEQVFLYTDGVTDARRANGEFFGRTRLLELLRGPARTSAERIEQIRGAVSDFGDGEPLFDDVTMLAITRASSTAGSDTSA